MRGIRGGIFHVRYGKKIYLTVCEKCDRLSKDVEVAPPFFSGARRKVFGCGFNIAARWARVCGPSVAGQLYTRFRAKKAKESIGGNLCGMC